MNKKKNRIVLALGGGGSRGLAHLGVIRAFTERNIPIDAIVGTSMGAIIGAMYAETKDHDLMLERIRSFFSSEQFHEIGDGNWGNKDVQDFWEQIFSRLKRQVVINVALQKKSLGDIGDLNKAINNLIFVKTFEELKIPFACVSCDLKSGKKLLLKEGSLLPALAASSAVPGFLPPVEFNGHLLSDGLISSVIPAVEAREFGEIVVAVDVHQTIPYQSNFNNALEIILRADLISSNFRSNLLAEKADFVISPDVGEYIWSDFKNWEKIVMKGYAAGKSRADELINLIADREKSGTFLNKSLLRVKHLFNLNK